MDFDFKLDLPQETKLATGEEKGKVFDLAILGGGPAGMTAGVYASRKQMDTVLISPDFGGQILSTSGIENYLGYQYVTGPELAEKFSRQIKEFPLKLISGEVVKSVAQEPENVFSVRTDAGREIKSRTLILATGKRWRKLNVPGEDHYVGRGVAYCAICDAPFFRGLPVVVAGGGNSAVTAAIDLLRGGSPVTLVNFVDGWQADPVLMDQVRGKVALLDAHQVVEVVGNGTKVEGIKVAPRAGGTGTTVQAEGLFVEIGLIPNTEIFKGFVALNADGEIEVDSATRTSRPGVYGAGDCTDVPEKQIIIAAGDGAKAALAAHHYLLNLRGRS